MSHSEIPFGGAGIEPEITNRVHTLKREFETGATAASALRTAGVPEANIQFLVGRAEAVQEIGARAVQLAFLSLLIEKDSKVAHAVSSATRTAHRYTASALLPYVEVDDLHSLVRWKLFRLPLHYFRRSELWTGLGILGLVQTVARNAALDEVRRLSRRPRRGDVEPLPGDESHASDTRVVFDDVRRAFERATQRHPRWLAEAAFALLLDLRDRKDVLREINERRNASGDPAWKPNALSAFLSRLRADLRRELEREP